MGDAAPLSNLGPGRRSNGASSPAIVAERVSRTFTAGRRRNRRTTDAVQDLTLRVERGERLAFIGPNGAGKSTSIKILTGILYPSAGSAEVLGLVPWQDRRQLAMRIGTLFGQRSQLWNELPPRRSLRVLGAIFGLDDNATNRRIAELGELLQASDLFDQPLRTQSLGQRMRCELAACMLHQPELLFLDEPTIGLDLLGKQLFRDLLVRVNEELGTTVFMTSHDVADIEQVAERAVVVNHGTIIYDNSVEAMGQDLLSTKRIEIGLGSAGASTASLTALPGVTTGNKSGASTSESRSLIVEVDTTLTPIRVVMDRVLAELPVTDLSIVDPPLEAVIGEIYQRPRS